MSLEIHDKTISELCSQISNSFSQKQPIGFSRKDGHSNTTRPKFYKEKTASLSLNDFNKVLHIDAEKMTALVEPGITMENLSKATLAHGLIPKVLPEFKGITAGGAVMGAALESSSHLHGQFNDACNSYQIILGDGAVINASAQENSDLFYGISGSYGSLGLLVSIEIQLVKASDWLTLTYRRFNSVENLLSYMSKQCRHPQPSEYIEGIVFNKNDGIVIEARQSTEIEKKKVKPVSILGRWDEWFVRHAQKTQDGEQESMPFFDYLFRYDRGAFWMGYYAVEPKFLWRHLSKNPKLLFGKVRTSKASIPRRLLNNNFMTRLLGPMMDSQRLYASLHAVPENWFAKTFVVQDFYIPMKNTNSFVEKVLEEVGINPLWICPIKAALTQQILAPHNRTAEMSDDYFINVGVYGIPQTGRPSIDSTCYLEKLCRTLGGRKMLYSQSYYTSNEFWEIYPHAKYLNLRQKYKAESTWLSIDEKVLTRL